MNTKIKLFNLIILLFFSYFSSAYSESEFNLSCKGTLIKEGGYTNDYKEDFYYEDIKVYVTKNRNIYKTETISTNKYLLRPENYWGGKVVPGKELVANKDLIELKSDQYVQEGYKSHGFSGQISLISGIYSGSSTITVLKDNVKFYYKFNTQCEGYQNLYTFINKSNSASEKSKSDPNKTPLEYKNYWWVLIILALGAFFLYTKTVPKPKKTKRKTKSKPTGFKKDLIRYWQGKVSYGFSYWVCLTIIGTIIALPAFYFFSDQFIDSASGIVILILMIYAVFILISQIFLIVGTWRSAELYKAQKRKLKQSLIWGYLGQISIVLSVIRKFAEFF